MSYGQEIFRIKYKETMDSLNIIKDNYYDLDVQYQEEINKKDKEIERLNKKYNKALELLADYNMPCEYDEGKIPDDYCEENCDDDYKKCWDKYIELELKGDSSSD